MKSPKIFTFFFILCIYYTFDALAQSKKPFFLIGDDTHFADEFNYAYSKNNLKEGIKKDSIDAYLELYINFRLKVKEAKTSGYDTTNAFKKEFNQYRGQLEESFLSPKKEQEALIKEAYGRSKWEIRASHILIRLDEEASPSDTLKAYSKIMEVRERALKGEDFSDLARIKSEDPSAKQNGGDLGYFSVFQMVYPFESVAYKTDVGKVSNPLRTQFGYHIIKIGDKRLNEGKVQVAHIMIRSSSKNGEDFRAAAKSKAFKIDSLLKTGNDWNQLCKTYSEDQNSVAQNGVLKPFGRGQIVPEFESAAFNLIDEGDISAPIKTQYGWHIIKLIKKIPVGELEEERSYLAKKIKSDSRSAMPRNEMLETLKEENHFKRNEEAVNVLSQLPPSVIINNHWQFENYQLEDTTELFSIGEISITSGVFLSSFNKSTFRKAAKLKVEIRKKIDNYEDSIVISFEKSRLPIKHTEYNFLVNEYYDGILLFSIMEDSVWNRSMKDSIGLNAYYEANKKNYVSYLRDTTVFSSDSKTTLDKIALDSPEELSREGWDALNSKLLKENNVSPLTLQAVLKADSKWEEVILSGDLRETDFIELEGRWFWVRKNKVVVYAPLNKIKGKVISDYQSYLDEKWVSSLKKKYPVRINKKQLNKVYAHFKATD
jgi:peptidyl-prolyl cis-trans isomerase SurA